MRALWDEMRRVIASANPCMFRNYRQRTCLCYLPPLRATGSACGSMESNAWNALMRIAEMIEHFDAQAREVHAQRGARGEQDKLDQYRLEVERLRTMRATADQELAAARLTQAQFGEANRELIHAAAAEVSLVAHHQRIKAAYDGFLPEIQAYLARASGCATPGVWGTGPRSV